MPQNLSLQYPWVQARDAETTCFLACICRANNDPPVTKIRLWASFWVWITTRCGPVENKLFLRRCSKHELAKPGKVFTVRFGPAWQSIGRGRLSREGALDVRESRERRDKIVPQFPPEKTGKTQFWPDCFHFLSSIACCSQDSTTA